jgi:hypothetical protein
LRVPQSSIFPTGGMQRKMWFIDRKRSRESGANRFFSRICEMALPDRRVGKWWARQGLNL